MKNTDVLTLQEAYLSMYDFLDELYKRTKSNEIGAMLGALSLLSDGSTADPAAWGDWLKCVERVQAGKVDAYLKITQEPSQKC